MPFQYVDIIHFRYIFLLLNWFPPIYPILQRRTFGSREILNGTGHSRILASSLHPNAIRASAKATREGITLLATFSVVWLVHGEQSSKEKKLYIVDYYVNLVKSINPGIKIKGSTMEDCADYGVHLVRLIDRRATMKEFEFDQTLLMPTAAGIEHLLSRRKLRLTKDKELSVKEVARKSIGELPFLCDGCCDIWSKRI